MSNDLQFRPMPNWDMAAAAQWAHRKENQRVWLTLHGGHHANGFVLAVMKDALILTGAGKGARIIPFHAILIFELD